MPSLAIHSPEQVDDVEEWVVVTWLKNESDRVNEGDPLVIVQAEKVSYEIEAPATGTLSSILVQQGEVVDRGAPLGHLETSEKMPQPASPAPAQQPAPPAERKRVVASPIARRLAREHNIDLAKVEGSGQDGRITERDVRVLIETDQPRPEKPAAVVDAPSPPVENKRVVASPVAKRLAREHGVDLAHVTGSGRGGRIVEEDVQAYLEQESTQPGDGVAPAATSVPLAGMRGTIAQRMHQSLQEMAQLTLITEADVTALVAVREALKTKLPITYTDLLIKTSALALASHPRLNSSLQENTVMIHEQIHIGLAVALEEGLVVPVIRNADRKTLAEISRERRRLAERARENRLTREEMSGGTFTVTNLGNYGIDGFTPIINPPEAAILGIGRIVEKVVVHQGKIAQRSMMTLSLSFDHRLVDGAPAAAFLQTVCNHLQEPQQLR